MPKGQSAGGGKHEVSSGESWESIARDVYGDERYAEQLAAANGGVALHPGMKIKTPRFAVTDAQGNKITPTVSYDFMVWTAQYEDRLGYKGELSQNIGEFQKQIVSDPNLSYQQQANLLGGLQNLPGYDPTIGPERDLSIQPLRGSEADQTAAIEAGGGFGLEEPGGTFTGRFEAAAQQGQDTRLGGGYARTPAGGEFSARFANAPQQRAEAQGGARAPRGTPQAAPSFYAPTLQQGQAEALAGVPDPRGLVPETPSPSGVIPPIDTRGLALGVAGVLNDAEQMVRDATESTRDAYVQNLGQDQTPSVAEDATPEQAQSAVDMAVTTLQDSPYATDPRTAEANFASGQWTLASDFDDADWAALASQPAGAVVPVQLPNGDTLFMLQKPTNTSPGNTLPAADPNYRPQFLTPQEAGVAPFWNTGWRGYANAGKKGGKGGRGGGGDAQTTRFSIRIGY